MSVKTKLTAIADDIREILNESAGMTLDEMSTKLDTVKTQIVEAIAAVNGVTGNVTTLPEMSAAVGTVTGVAGFWAEAALITALQLNGEDFSSVGGQDVTIASQVLQEAYAAELEEMRTALEDAYTAVDAKYGVIPAESERYLKNLKAAIETIGSTESDYRTYAVTWFTATLNLLNLVNAVDVSGFAESDAFNDATQSTVSAHAQNINTAMGNITTAITEMGGTAPTTQAVDNFPAAIRTIPTGSQWYDMMLATLTALNAFDPSTITGGMNDEATETAVQAAADQAKTDLTAAYTTITANGGTLPQEQTIANLPAAIESIPPATGVTVQRHAGTFTTDASGKTIIYTSRMPFKPDVFVITGLMYGNHETQMAFVYPEAIDAESGYAVQAVTWTDEYEYGLEASVMLMWDGSPNRMEITMTKYSSSGNYSAVTNTTFNYTMIKYTA